MRSGDRRAADTGGHPPNPAEEPRPGGKPAAADVPADRTQGSTRGLTASTLQAQWRSRVARDEPAGAPREQVPQEGPRGGDAAPPPHRRRKSGGRPKPQPAAPERASPGTTARPACPPPHPIRAREGAAARPRRVTRGGSAAARRGTTAPRWRARQRRRGRGHAERTGETSGRVGPPGKHAGSHRHTRGRSRTACDADPTSGPNPGASHETRHPTTTGGPSTRQDAWPPDASG